jgi:hypothetical protein
MKKEFPTLEEVKEHFKNAKEVRCAFTKKVIDISIEISKDIHFCDDEYWIDNYNPIIESNLWDENLGYAEIISFKEKKQTIKDLLKGTDFENLKWNFYSDVYRENSKEVRFDNRLIKITQKELEKLVGGKFEVVN